MGRESTQITARIDRPADDVYAFASNPANIPQWAPGLGASVEQVEGQCLVDTPDGRVGVAFAEHNDFGVLDHKVTLPSGEVSTTRCAWSRTVMAAKIFTLRRQPDMSDADFERDAGLVQADLLRLKQVMEAGS
jgi:hypothetical protein